MSETSEKLRAAQTAAGVEYSGGNLSSLVQIPLENLFISYLSEKVFEPEFGKTFLAYVIKTGEDFSHAIHFPVDFRKDIHSITDSAILVNPDTTLFILKQGNEDIDDDHKEFNHFKSNSIANFEQLTQLVNGVPAGITADLQSGKQHTRDFRFSEPRFTIDFILNR